MVLKNSNEVSVSSDFKILIINSVSDEYAPITKSAIDGLKSLYSKLSSSICSLFSNDLDANFRTESKLLSEWSPELMGGMLRNVL